jgi:hypothetical protein
LGCDQGHQDDESPIDTTNLVTAKLSSTNVQAGGAVVVQFNRLLNPGTVTRQTIQLLTAGGQTFVDPIVDYDPVLLAVTLSNPGGGAMWLVPGQTYQVKMGVATTTVAGVLAIDNAPMASATELDFNVTGPLMTPAAEPQMHFCVDILPIFTSKCSASFCHGSPAMTGTATPRFPDGGTFPAAGLVLDNSQGVLDTAIGHVAHGSNVGPTAGGSSPSCGTPTDTCSFGVDMPIIDPGTNGSGNPGNSWLLYKTLLDDTPMKDDNLLAQCAPVQTYETKTNPAVVITSAERSILSNYILGREMPYPTNPAAMEGTPASATDTVGLSMQELERVRLWIKQGAKLETVTKLGPDGGLIDAGLNCGSCDLIFTTDGGDGAVSEGGTDGSRDAGTDAPTDSTVHKD